MRTGSAGEGVVDADERRGDDRRTTARAWTKGNPQVPAVAGPDRQQVHGRLDASSCAATGRSACARGVDRSALAASWALMRRRAGRIQAASARSRSIIDDRRQDGRRRAAARLGLRGDAGLCDIARGRLPIRLTGPGHGPRHVLPPARGAARPGRRGEMLHAACST